MAQVPSPQSMTKDRGLVEKLDRAGWGVALIWVGAAILLNVSWGAGLLGLGTITLVGQLLRRYFSLACDWFALAMGVCFVLAGMGPVFGDRLATEAVLPILSIALGSTFLVSALFRRQSTQAN